MKRALKLGAGIATVLVAACGGGELTDESADALSAGSATMVSVRADPRKSCTPLQCGGYYLRDLNKATGEVYVGALDFSKAGLDAATVAAVQGAPASELLFSGRLGAVDAHTRQRSFVVTEAYRGMPGYAPSAGDAFYEVADHATRQCVAAPCLDQLASAVNGSATVPFSSYSVAAASTGFLDQGWLIARVRDHGAIVAGRVVNGQAEPGGTDRVLAASQVFLRLPEGVGPCTKLGIKPTCAAGQVLTYVRDEDRCLAPATCVTPAACPRMQPACAPGYTQESWPSGPNACTFAVCDPTFSL